MPPLPDNVLPVEDTYFLDRLQARAEALKQQLIRMDDGRERLQYCYHPGPDFPDTPENLVAVPITSYVDYFIEHYEKLPTRFSCDLPGLGPEQRQAVLEDFKTLNAELVLAFSSRTATADELEQIDCFFLDANQALATALQRNQVKEIHPRIRGLQICYYSSDPLEAELENLIHIPPDQLLDFFKNTRMRLPRAIIFPPSTPAQTRLDITRTFTRLLTEACDFRREAISQLGGACREQRPDFVPGEPLRFFLPACRLTEVMQYCSINLGRALERLGHQVKVSIEANAMELLPPAWHLQEQLDFQPHVVVHINHQGNEWLHPEVFNVVWWQDPIGDIMRAQPIPWRERDLIFSVDPFFDGYLSKSGAPKVLRQRFCIDTEVFRPDPAVERRRKLVFIGSSYHSKLSLLSPAGREFVQQAMTELAAGRLVATEEIRRFTRDDAEAMWIRNHIVRDTVIHWACEQQDMEVEIYGRGWEHDPAVMAHFRGELPHGEAVARVYRQASHALVAMPLVLNSQRLAEIAACGCIPVVYDIRYEAEPPHWDNECLFFTTRDELFACLTRRPAASPVTIAESFSYDVMARRIIDMIHEHLGWRHHPPDICTKENPA